MQPGSSKSTSRAADDDEKTLDERLREMPNVRQFWDNNFYPIRAFEMHELGWFFDQGMDEDLIVYALKKAVAAGKRRLDYVQGILRRYIGDNVFTLDDALVRDEEYERRKAREPPAKGKKRTVVRDDPEYKAELAELSRQLAEKMTPPERSDAHAIGTAETKRSAMVSNSGRSPGVSLPPTADSDGRS